MAGRPAQTRTKSKTPTKAGNKPASSARIDAGSRLAAGQEVVRAHLVTLPRTPGVYRMLNGRGDALYVGKARSLRNRVATYAAPDRLPVRLQRMVAETEAMEFVTTHTEVEALLLEANLINRLRPRYNILMRDDKSFPYILITGDHPFPQLVKYRGPRKRKGRYFGPFATVNSVHGTVTALQRAFLLRNCTDVVFRSRTRPCLQYQIKRCSAPCVGRITESDYAALVDQSCDFLAGRSTRIQERLAAAMEEASAALDFERAASLRDRIRALTQVQTHQDINLPGVQEADIVALHQEGGQSCIQVFFFRSGRNFGNRAYFPAHDRSLGPGEVIAAFVGQFYERHPPPRRILLSHEPDDRALLEEALCLKAERTVRLAVPRRGTKRRPVEHALSNARDALGRRLAESAAHRRLLGDFADVLGLDGPLERIEIYDNSHIQGAHAVGAMVVSGRDGFEKGAYRKFNIRDTDVGDDYAMMREVLTRRFSRAMREDPDRKGESWPNLVILDGGPGQLRVAEAVFVDLGLDGVALLACAKGPDRNAGRERLHQPGRKARTLDARDPVLYFIQRLRDEAHRFAIGSHRVRRKKANATSPLDAIPGVGAKRKKALLMYFGSASSVSRAGLADIEAVEGISRATAQRIYGHFHDGG